MDFKVCRFNRELWDLYLDIPLGADQPCKWHTVVYLLPRFYLHSVDGVPK